MGLFWRISRPCSQGCLVFLSISFLQTPIKSLYFFKKSHINTDPGSDSNIAQFTLSQVLLVTLFYTSLSLSLLGLSLGLCPDSGLFIYFHWETQLRENPWPNILLVTFDVYGPELPLARTLPSLRKFPPSPHAAPRLGTPDVFQYSELSLLFLHCQSWIKSFLPFWQVSEWNFFSLIRVCWHSRHTKMENMQMT